MKFGIALVHIVASIAALVLGSLGMLWLFSGRGWPEMVAVGAAVLVGGLFGAVVWNLCIALVSTHLDLKGYLHHGK